MRMSKEKMYNTVTKAGFLTLHFSFLTSYYINQSNEVGDTLTRTIINLYSSAGTGSALFLKFKI